MVLLRFFFNQAITDNPLNDYAYISKSSCFEGEKKAELLHKAVSINPNNDLAYRAFSNTLAESTYFLFVTIAVK